MPQLTSEEKAKIKQSAPRRFPDATVGLRAFRAQVLGFKVEGLGFRGVGLRGV